MNNMNNVSNNSGNEIAATTTTVRTIHMTKAASKSQVLKTFTRRKFRKQ